MAGASGRGSLRAGERRHSPFIRQRRRKALPARIRRKSLSAIAREGFLDRRSKRCFWLLLSPQTKVARAGARNSPCAGCGGDGGVLRRCAATPHPPPSGAPSPQGEGLRVRHSHREPLKGKADGGVSFNAANPSRGRLTEVRHSTPRPIKGEGLGLCGPGTRLPVTSSGGRLTPADGGRKKDRRGRSFCLLFGCTAYWDLFCSFWSMAVNSGGRGQWSSTGSPVRGWTKRRPVAWRHWPVRPGTGFLAP